MSYRTDRIMSLGCSAIIAEGLKELGIREPSPVDWVDMNGAMPSLLQLFTGDLYKSILKNNFYSRTYEEYIRYRCPGAEEFEWYLEKLDDIHDYKKIISRFVKLEEHIRKNGKFIYLCTPSDTYDSIDAAIYLIETMVPNYDPKNILLIAPDNIKMPSFCTSYQIPVDVFENIDNNNSANLIKDAIESVNWVEFLR